MSNIDRYVRFFGTHQWVVQQQTDGISHDESVLQLPFPGNCMNWILGHIVAYRQNMLTLLDVETIMSDEEQARYTFGSEPVTNGEDCVRFEKLLELFEESQQMLLDQLGAMSDDDLTVIVNPDDEEGKQATLGARLDFLQWHEGYHVGQFEPLRQLAGKNDKII